MFDFLMSLSDNILSFLQLLDASLFLLCICIEYANYQILLDHKEETIEVFEKIKAFFEF